MLWTGLWWTTCQCKKHGHFSTPLIRRLWNSSSRNLCQQKIAVTYCGWIIQLYHYIKRNARRGWNINRQKSYADHVRATQLKNELSRLTRSLCREFERDLARNVKTNPKAFWRYCNSKLKNKPKLGDLKNSEGAVVWYSDIFRRNNRSFVVQLFLCYLTDSLPVMYLLGLFHSVTCQTIFLCFVPCQIFVVPW